MERLGRTMLWPDFVRKSSEENGTLIVAADSHKGPVRWWWTADNIYELCPYPLVDWIAMFNGPKFKAAVEWVASRYTGPDGQAFLILASSDEMGSLLRDSIFVEGIRWVDIPSARRS